MKKVISLLVFSVICLNISAQSRCLHNLDATKAMSQKVTELFKQNKISAAINELRPFWPIPQNEVEGLEEKTVKYLNMLEERFGKAEGILKVNEQTIKDVSIRETYLVQYENTAIRLIFTYYRNSKGWIINGFKWDDSFTEEFK